MTSGDDSFDTEPNDEPGFVMVRFYAREDVYNKLTTAAATQGMSVTTAINAAMQHYEVTLSAEPGNVLRFRDADDQTRRIYIVPSNVKLIESVMSFGIAMMMVAAPFELLWPPIFVVWCFGAICCAVCWIMSKD